MTFFKLSIGPGALRIDPWSTEVEGRLKPGRVGSMVGSIVQQGRIGLGQKRSMVDNGQVDLGRVGWGLVGSIVESGRFE